jgi:ABC-type oligopeptide transport system substrate-binding subunit
MKLSNVILLIVVFAFLATILALDACQRKKKEQEERTPVKGIDVAKHPETFVSNNNNKKT